MFNETISIQLKEVNVTDSTGKQPRKVGFFANQPENNNLLEKTAFKMVIPKIPEVSYFCQSVSLPGISKEKKIRPIGKVRHETFEVNFLVSENMSNWLEIYNWIQSLSNYEDFEKFVEEEKSIVSDAVLYVLSSKNNVSLKAQFHGLFPISLSSVSFDYTDSELQVTTASVTFAFSYYEIVAT